MLIASSKLVMVVMFLMLVLIPAVLQEVKIGSSFHEQGLFYGAWVIIIEHKMIIREGIDFEIIGHVDLDLENCDLGSWTGVLSKQDVVNEFKREGDMLKIFKSELIPLRKIIK